MKHPDTLTLSRKIDWPKVRTSLRGSIAKYSELMPLVKIATKRTPPSTWQRVKSYFGYSLVDRFIDTYITPEGLPKLYRLRETQRGIRTVAGVRASMEVSTGSANPASRWLGAAAQFAKRLQRAEFLSLFEVELVLRDRFDKDRLIVSVFELKSLEWTLTSLRLVRQIAADAQPNLAAHLQSR